MHNSGDRFHRPHRLHFIHASASTAQPHHDTNHVSFTLDFPDASKPSIGVTIHPLSQCYCRYMIIISHKFIVTLPLSPHSNTDADEHPFNDLRRAATQTGFNGTPLSFAPNSSPPARPHAAYRRQCSHRCSRAKRSSCMSNHQSPPPHAPHATIGCGVFRLWL
jgi:hypothetical protein